MSEAGQGEWFADADGQWTWRQPDGSCWRQGPDGGWQEFAGAAPPHHVTPTFGFQALGADEGHSVHAAHPSPVSQIATDSPPHPGPAPVFESGHLPGGSPQVQVGVLPGDSPQTHAGVLPGDSPQVHAGVLPGGDPGADLLHGDEAHAGHHPDHRMEAPRIKKETSAMAVWALVLAILNLCFVGVVIGIILGFEALHHIKHSHGSLRGKTPAILAILAGVGWLVTIPTVLIPAGINGYHSVRTTASDAAAKGELNAVLDGVNGIFKVSHTFSGITPSSIPVNLPLVHLSATCSAGNICMNSGSGLGYTFVQMCKTTGSHHAWMISQTSESPAWYGEASGGCPSLGDPGSGSNQPAQPGEWRQGGFPAATFDMVLLGHHIHWKL